MIPSVIKTQIFHSDSDKYQSKLTGFHLFDTGNHVIGSVVDQNTY